MRNELSCTFCNSELIASNARICGNRPECQTLYCNDQCAQRDWDQHYTQCSTLKLIQSGRGPETTEEEAQRLRRKLAKLRKEAAREEAAAAERAKNAELREKAAREEAAAAAAAERAKNAEVKRLLSEVETLREQRRALAEQAAELEAKKKLLGGIVEERRRLHKAKGDQGGPDNKKK